MKIFLASTARKLGYVFAALVIIAAIFISVTRLTAPLLEKHKTDFENWASQLLEASVTIDKVKVTWYRYQPDISLEQVTVLDKNTKKPNLQIKEVSIFFSLLKSLWYFKPVPNGIMINGSEVNIHQTPNGQYAVQGFPMFGGFKQPLQSESKMSDVMAWLATQPHIILENVDVHYTDSQNVNRFVTLYHLSLANNGEQHSISGKAVLHQEIPTEVTTAVTWTGNEVDLNKIKANLYLYVSGFSLPQWFQGKTWDVWQIKDGIASAKIWAAWDLGAFRSIQSTFQFYALNLLSAADKTEHKINRLSGTVGWKHEANSNQQIFAGNDILIDLPSHLWPVTNFYITTQQDESGTLKPKEVNLGYVDISDVQSFLFSTPSYLSSTTKNYLTEFKPSGSLQNLTMTLLDVGQVSLSTDFANLSFSEAHTIPGMKNLTGSLKWNGIQGDAILHSERVVLNDNSIFMNPLTIDQLSGDAHIEHDQNSNTWKINVTSLQALNSDLAANASGTIVVPQNASPNVDLHANFTMQRAPQIIRYLPLHVFDPGLVTWLRQAFSNGEITSAEATFKGNVTDFPFDNQNGTFLVLGTIKNIDLNYAPDWPQIKHINAKLAFSGRALKIDVSQGVMNGLPISNVHGEIPYLGDEKPAILTIASDEIHGDFMQGLQFIHASPLEKTIGKMFTEINLRGPMTLKLGLQVPLKTPDDISVQGDITFKDTDMELVPWNLTISKLIGQLHFTEKSTNAENIQGELFGKPLQFNLATVQQDKTSVVQATFNNNLNVADIENWLKVPLSKTVQGETEVNGKITFGLDKPIQIELQSNLVGLTIDLPDEYSKSKNQEKAFDALIFIQENQPLRLKVNYGALINAAFILNRKQNAFSLLAANLHLGEGEAAWPQGQGLYITGDFNELKWDKIKGYLNQSGKNNFSKLPPLKNIDINAKKLTLGSVQINQVNIDVIPSNNIWDIHISSPDVDGSIQAPVNFNSNSSVTAQFQRLNLHSTTSTNAETSVDVKSLPAINFTASNVAFNDMKLGQITFQGMPANGGMNIQTMRISSQYMDLQANGSWAQGNVTHLQGKATSTNVSQFLNNLGVDAHNFVSSNGKVTFDLNWHGAPYAPALANFSGTASLDIGRGRIVDVGAASGAKIDFGKMLSIFSLQSIPRRLTFDFSDLFQKGYSFDYVRGNFSFKNGDAYTSDLKFDGPIAKINIDGRIGLKNKDYDFTLSVTPYVTSSLPVAAALLTGPVGGVAALAANAVIGSALSSAVTYYYSVRGPWNNPTWQSIGRKAGQRQSANTHFQGGGDSYHEHG